MHVSHNQNAVLGSQKSAHTVHAQPAQRSNVSGTQQKKSVCPTYTWVPSSTRVLASLPPVRDRADGARPHQRACQVHSLHAKIRRIHHLLSASGTGNGFLLTPLRLCLSPGRSSRAPPPRTRKALSDDSAVCGGSRLSRSVTRPSLLLSRKLFSGRAAVDDVGCVAFEDAAQHVALCGHNTIATSQGRSCGNNMSPVPRNLVVCRPVHRHLESQSPLCLGTAQAGAQAGGRAKG